MKYSLMGTYINTLCEYIRIWTVNGRIWPLLAFIGQILAFLANFWAFFDFGPVVATCKGLNVFSVIASEILSCLVFLIVK
jgi:hypothetical protein